MGSGMSEDTSQPWADLMAGLPSEMLNGVVMTSCGFSHPTLGIVSITVRSNSRCMTARRKGELIALSIPPGVPVIDLMKFLHQVRTNMPLPTRLLHYHDGDRIEAAGVTFVIERKDGKGMRVEAYPTLPVTTIEVGEKIDLTHPNTTRRLTFIIKKLAAYFADKILLPEAATVAAKVGVRPTAWKISAGERTLGYCNAQGVISLSAMLMFYPSQLREYVICHELAHLQEMNHSRRFHALCNLYCGGRESELEAALRSYHVPLHK